ncbi:MAG: EamA family transporter [Dehalococcoidia bacterium]|nr:EamA family transporter [Dehalococcoidia bacterium]
MGEFFALISGFSFAASNVYTRRGVFFARESFSPLPISMSLGVIIFLAAVLISGDMNTLGLLSWKGIFFLSAAGIVHFVIGRSCNYNGLRRIGANRTAPLMATNVLFATFFGIIFLSEELALIRGLGILTVFIGLLFIGTSAERTATGEKLSRSVFLKGTAFGMGSGICYGISPLLVKIGLREIGSPYAGGFVSYLAAGIIVLILLNRKRVDDLKKLTRPAFMPMFIGGVAVTAAQIFRYVALAFAPINVVTPLTSTNNVFVPFLSYFINRKMETFSTKVLGGTVLVIAGVFAVLLS